MKHPIHLFLLFYCTTAYAQDSLFLKNSNVYAVTVTGKTPENIKYRNWNNSDSTIYSLPLSSINVVKYSSGAVDSVMAEKNAEEHDSLPYPFQDFQGTSPQKSTNSDQDGYHTAKPNSNYMFDKGVTDANINYQPAGGIFGGAFAGGFLLGPIFGLIPAAGIAGADVRPDRLNYPDAALMNNNAYRDGYTSSAHKKKVRRTWIGYGVGVGADVAFTLILVAISEAH